MGAYGSGTNLGSLPVVLTASILVKSSTLSARSLLHLRLTAMPAPALEKDRY